MCMDMNLWVCECDSMYLGMYCYCVPVVCECVCVCVYVYGTPCALVRWRYGCVCVFVSVWEYICESVTRAGVCLEVACVFR